MINWFLDKIILKSKKTYQTYFQKEKGYSKIQLKQSKLQRRQINYLRNFLHPKQLIVLSWIP